MRGPKPELPTVRDLVQGIKKIMEPKQICPRCGSLPHDVECPYYWTYPLAPPTNKERK
jgi:hypothetical protein